MIYSENFLWIQHYLLVKKKWWEKGNLSFQEQTDYLKFLQINIYEITPKQHLQGCPISNQLQT